jgi:quercetin dioxygenase-like cupin family protein
MKRILIGLALLGLGGSGFGQEMKMVKVEDLVWKEHPVFKGAQTVILVGDPTKAETIVQRTKFPPNYRVPPHTHPYAEVVTVLSGNYWNSFGQSFDKTKGVELHPGSVFVLPAGHAHYTWTEDTEVIVQVNFTGPGGVTFINPADDPRQKGARQTCQSPDAFGLNRLPPGLFGQLSQLLQATAGRCTKKVESLGKLAAASGG